jgi:hypothetical protein
MKMDKDLEAPCVTCNNYSNWVPFTAYAPNHGPQTLKEAVDDWFKKDYEQDVVSEELDKWFKRSNGVTQEDFWTNADSQYDTVSKPKHYMLFKYDELYKYEEGVEVRDVIEKLVNKIPPVSRDYGGLFVADYVQMIQYLMRFMDKNGVEDLKKARWYLDKLIDSYDKPDF